MICEIESCIPRNLNNWETLDGVLTNIKENNSHILPQYHQIFLFFILILDQEN